MVFITNQHTILEVERLDAALYVRIKAIGGEKTTT